MFMGSMIERDHLEILRQVAHDGTLTAAAKSMHLTQSALSHAIRKLEDQAGIALWHRRGRRLELTAAGRYLLSQAERLLPQFERIDERLHDYAAGEFGSLRIGMECHPCYRWLLRVIAPYLAAWPRVDLDVVQQFQFGGMAALFQRDIDILVTPDPLHQPGAVFIPVFDYEQVLVVHKDHRLAERPYIVADDLLEETLFTYPVPTSRLDVYTHLLTTSGVQPKKHKTVESTDVLLQMVASQRGVSALPRWLVKEYEDVLPISAVRLGPSGISKQIHLGIRSSSQDEPPVVGFLQLANAISSPTPPTDPSE